MSDSVNKTKLPEAFVKQMENILKAEAEAFFKSYEEANVMSLRVNPAKASCDIADFFPTAVETVEWEKCGRYYQEADAPGRHPLHNAGLYYIQEASAMAPAALLMQAEVSDNDRILDLCAAPGGKSTQIAGYMRGKGLLICNEIVPKRAKILSENIERMGVTNALVINHDPLELKDRFEGFFTRILVDAPCSGEGMFRKHPEAGEEWSPENVQLCASRQDYILDCAAKMLCEGGTIVYSTCTFNDEEDEGSVLRFLERHPEFDLIRDAESDEVGIHLWPHIHKGEGHFLAKLRKKGDIVACVAQKSENITGLVAQKSKSTLADRGRKNSNNRGKRDNISGNDVVLEFLESYIKNDYVNRIINNSTLENVDNYLAFGDNIYLPPAMMPDLRGLKVLRPGLHIGTIGKGRFEPSHALALVLSKDNVKSSIELTIDEATQYLKGMTISNEKTALLEKGWCLVCVEGYSLGWGKAAGGILKNHYPKGLRIC